MAEEFTAETVRRAFDVPRELWPTEDYWRRRRDAMEETRERMRRAIEQLAEALRFDSRRVGAQFAHAFRLGKSRIPHAPSHPRKGDFDWLTGKPLQGRRYRQACRSYNRQVRYRRIAQRELGGLR